MLGGILILALLFAYVFGTAWGILQGTISWLNDDEENKKADSR